MSTAVAERPAATNGTPKTEVAIAPQSPPREIRVVQDNSAFANLLDTARFEHLWRIANSFAASELVPAQFQKKPNNCFVALQMALRLQVDPFMFLQGCYVVHGRPGIESKLAIALANRSGVFRTRIGFTMGGEGMNRTCRASAAVAETGETVEETVTMQMAKAEGWLDKAGSKWKTMPDLMLKYRSAMFLIRLHCPEVIMGLSTREEMEDAPPQPVTIESRTVRLSDLDALTQQLESASDSAGQEREPGDESPEADAPGELPSLATLADELAAVTMVGDVHAIEKKYLDLLPDDHIEVGIACADRIKEIKASRGTASK